MKLNRLIDRIDEARGSGSFDYKFWFWAKKGSQYGFGYARQNIKLDISVKNEEIKPHPTVQKAIDALDNIKDVEKELEKGDDANLEVIEKKIKANTKRVEGIAQLFSSPIVIHWLTSDRPSVVKIPQYKPGDVTDSDGGHVKILEIFQDPDIREFITKHANLDSVTINDDKTGDTLNTIITKFVKLVFGDKGKGDRKMARTSGLENVMSSLHFENNGIEVVSFKKTDYNILPKQLLGSKKIISKINEIKEKNFKKILGKARSAF
jgi:hypothetical protein